MREKFKQKNDSNQTKGKKVIEKEKERGSFTFPVRCRDRTEYLRSRGTMGTHGNSWDGGGYRMFSGNYLSSKIQGVPENYFSCKMITPR